MSIETGVQLPAFQNAAHQSAPTPPRCGDDSHVEVTDGRLTDVSPRPP